MDSEAYEAMGEILFEKMKFKGAYVANQSVLSLFASGRWTGVCTTCGYSVTEAVPVIEGFPVVHAAQKLQKMKMKWYRVRLGGKLVIDRFLELWSKRNAKYELSGHHERRAGKEMVESLGYVASDSVNEERRKSESVRFAKWDLSKTFALPDSEKVVFVKDERYECCEILFSPWEDLGYDLPSITDLVPLVVEEVDEDIRREMYQNIVLGGGTTKINGFEERFRKELRKVKKEVIVKAPPEREYSAWIGGSVISCLGSFRGRWVSDEEWEEGGVDLFRRKCTLSVPLKKKSKSELFRFSVRGVGDGVGIFDPDLSVRVEFVWKKKDFVVKFLNGRAGEDHIIKFSKRLFILFR